MDNSNVLEINTLTKGTAEPKVIKVNDKEYQIKVFAPADKLFLMDYLSKFIVAIKNEMGMHEFRYFNPRMLGDLLIVAAVMGKEEHLKEIMRIIKKGLNVDDKWIEENNLFGEYKTIWTLFNEILKAQGINIVEEPKPVEKKSQ